MKSIFKILAVAVTAAFAMPAAAQVVAELNGARADDRWGAELGIGYSLPILPNLKITPGAGALIYAEDNGRYYYYDNGGRQACRDSSNGQYAKEELCSNARFRAYGRLEATYTIPAAMTVGIGARISDRVVPYGTIGFPIALRLQLKGNVGDGYYAAGLRLGF